MIQTPTNRCLNVPPYLQTEVLWTKRMQMVAGTEPTRQKFFAKRGATQHGRQSIGEVNDERSPRF